MSSESRHGRFTISRDIRRTQIQVLLWHYLQLQQNKRFLDQFQRVCLANKHMKTLNIVYHEELQIKATIRYHYTPTRKAKIQSTDSIKCWGGCRATETLILCWWESKMFQPLWKTIWSNPTIQQSLSLVFSQMDETYVHTDTWIWIIIEAFS